MSEKKQAKEVIETLMPKVQEAVKAAVEGTLASKLPSLKDTLRSEIWDLAVAEIGRQLNLPKELIQSLQKLDDLVKDSRINTGTILGELDEKVKKFQERLNGVDLNKTITMSYAELRSVRTKVAISWGTICGVLGFFLGIVVAMI